MEGEKETTKLQFISLTFWWPLKEPIGIESWNVLTAEIVGLLLGAVAYCSFRSWQ